MVGSYVKYRKRKPKQTIFALPVQALLYTAALSCKLDQGYFTLSYCQISLRIWREDARHGMGEPNVNKEGEVRILKWVLYFAHERMIE